MKTLVGKSIIFLVFGIVSALPRNLDLPKIENAELLSFDHRGIQLSPNPCKGKTTGKVCSTDCTGILDCINGEVNTAYQMTCPKTTPYCSSTPLSTTCNASIDSCIIENEPTLPPEVCPQPTFSMDYLDCRKFYYCNGGKYKYQYYCSSDTVWVQEFKLCRKITPPTITCQNVTMSCSSSTTGSVANSNNPASYFVCSPTISLRNCPEGYIYSASLGYCQLKCTTEGRFQNVADSGFNTYYECIQTAPNVITATLKTCSENTQFDKINSVCIFG